MDVLSLRSIVQPDLPLEMECVNPLALRGLSLGVIAKLPIAYGNRTVELGEFFQISGGSGDLRITIEGDCSKVNRLGERMTVGEIQVHGRVGRHLGAYLAGGEIQVFGDAGDWAGAEMTAGSIRIAGDAGSQLGAGYRGSRLGMKGGTISVTGNAGDEVGLRMRRGLIVVDGEVGDHAGAAMIAGTIVARTAGTACGAGMKRGTILLHAAPKEFSPGHRFACRCRPSYLGLLQREISRLTTTTCIDFEREFDCLRGDLLHGAQGELWVAADHFSR